ncbi:hypothetical protein GCK32_017936 [Trichostrongylus colubriformis]|uniref:Uncharacterized protein n=1 Tax=Trichostrongylus colubriformis TaxID=6319 RepID=A0AAN8FJW0_TRICO
MSASHRLVSGCFRTSTPRSYSLTMKLIVLAILAGIALSTSSVESTENEMGTCVEIPDSAPRGVLKKNGTVERKSGRKVRFNSTCKWSEYNLQSFKEITNSSLRTFLQTKLGGIGSSDCVLFYQVENNDGGSPYYPIRIDRQTRFSSCSLYGIVDVDDGGNFKWNPSYREKFEHYLAWCDSKAGVKDEYPEVPRYLSCKHTLMTPTTPSPQVIPTTSVEEVIPPLDEATTPAPQVTPSQEASSTAISTQDIPIQEITPTTPPLDETTTPAPQVTPSRELASTTLSTRAILTQKITSTTTSPIPPRGVTTKKPTKKTRKGLREMFKSLNCFSCVE